MVLSNVIVDVNNSPIQDYVHPDDQTQPTFQMTAGFKPFTVIHFSLDISTIKCDYNVHCAVKTVFYLTLGYFLRTPDNSNLFSISLEGSSYGESTVVTLF